MEGGYDGEMTVEVVEEGCATPTHEGCRIPSVPVVCPPPPRKKRWSAYGSGGGKREPPKDGYFSLVSRFQAVQSDDTTNKTAIVISKFRGHSKDSFNLLA
ncbi:hypothetical protein L1887_05434 [Cichorium endivia]|nr:hypothetical protein L1887_05434 [Cichorium endivia]